MLSDGMELKAMILDMYNKRMIVKTNVPVSDQETITWIGHSEEVTAEYNVTLSVSLKRSQKQGVLLIAGSSGYVFGLFPQFDWQWTPVIDFYEVKKNKHDGHWIIGLTEDKLVYIPLAPGVQAPPVTAQRPPTQVCTFLLNVVALNTPLLLRSSLFLYRYCETRTHVRLKRKVYGPSCTFRSTKPWPGSLNRSMNRRFACLEKSIPGDS